MSAHATEVLRCRWCREQVAVVPAGFALTPDELRLLADEHLPQCTATLEGAAQDA